MGVRNRQMSYPTVLLAAVFLCALLFPSSRLQAAADEAPTVRIGYYDNPPKLFRKADGPPRGIFPDIVTRIAKAEGWRLEWVSGSWREGLERLEAGTIDVMPDVAFSLERSKKYAFTEEPVFINWGTLYVRPGVSVHSLQDIAGLRVAVMRGSIHTDGREGIKSQAKNFGLDCVYVAFESYDDVFRALQTGLADVGVVNRLFGAVAGSRYDVLPTTVVFNPRHLKFAFPPQGEKTEWLKAAIDKRLRGDLHREEPLAQGIVLAYLSGMPGQWMASSASPEQVWLSAEEKAWIRNHPEIRLGIDPEFAPFEFMDDQGRYSGFAADYVALLNRRLGLNMRVLPGLSWKEVMAAAQTGGIDLLPAVGFTRERSLFLRYSDPYVGFHRVIITRTDAPFLSGLKALRDLEVAVQAASSHEGWLKENTDLRIKSFDTLASALQGVSEGRAGAFVGNLASATYWIRQLSLTNLKVAAPAALERQLLHFAVRRDWPMLQRILNKGLASVTSEEAARIENRWTAAGYQVGISREKVWRRAFGAAILIAVALGLFLAWNVRLKRRLGAANRSLIQEMDARRRLAAMMEQANEVMVLAGTDLKVVYVNREYERVTGRSAAETVGIEAAALFGAGEGSADYAKAWGACRQGFSGQVRLTFSDLKGAVRRQECQFFPIRDEAGDLLGHGALQWDVTEKEALEAQLHQAQKMEALGQLAGGVAHDFNNLLGVILGYAEISLQKKPGPLVEAHLYQIHRAGIRARDLVAQLLVFSRRRQPEKQPLQLSLLVKEVLGMIRAAAPATIEIERRIEASDALVMADPTQIHQLLMNLCANALQAMKEAAGTLTVSLNRGEPPAGPDWDPTIPCLMLSVHDEGVGMTKEVRERLFEPFFTTKSEGKGTGLGMAVAHGIVADHGGAIDVKSAPGAGTTVSVLLPEYIGGAKEGLEEEGAPIPGEGRILLVDDEPQLLEVGKETLESLGYQVTMENDPLAAWARLEREGGEGFAAVITDQAMPKMSGKELGRKIRERCPDLPVIISTGFSDTLSSEQAAALGFQGFLQKPVGIHDFSRLLARVIDPARRSAGS